MTRGPVEWVAAQKASAPTIIPGASKVAGATRLAQHHYASLRMTTKTRLMRKVMTPPRARIDHISLVQQLEYMVRWHGGKTGGQALSDETKRAITKDVCPAEVERHPVLDSYRHHMYPKVNSGIRDYVEQLRHKSDPMQTDELRW